MYQSVVRPLACSLLAALLVLGAVVAAIVTAVAVAVVVSIPHLRASDLANLPEAAIVYPGSVRLQTIAEDSSFPWSGEAYLTQIYEVDATADQVAAYYRDRLTAQGWRLQRPLARTGLAEPIYEYVLGNRRIDLSFPSTSPPSPSTSPPSGMTRYSYTIAEHP